MISFKTPQLTFHIITSKIFWSGAPMVISEIVKRGYYISVFDENNLPKNNILLECDVFIDMSTITKDTFYQSLQKELLQRKLSKLKLPIMVDPPKAILNSVDKRKTHKLFPDLIPESYNLTGTNNLSKINKFANDKYVVIKPAVGWWGKNIERISPQEAIKKYVDAKDVIIQKYVPFVKGVGRIVTINYGNYFEIACSYTRQPKSWRTGIDIEHKCIKQSVTNDLYEFARKVSIDSELYLNGIDYIYNNGKYILLEVNAVPAMIEPFEEFKINVPQKLINHIERILLSTEQSV